MSDFIFTKNICIFFFSIEVYAHVLRMLPAEITQKENQYVVYKGNRYADSCYVTKKQHTKINVASETIKSYTKDGHENVSGKKMKYGNPNDPTRSFPEQPIE
jgi:hypothetical protein